MSLSVIKLGGSAITVKKKPFTARRRIISHLCDQIVRYVNEGGKVVIVHGGGSFGHPMAIRYRLNEGLSCEEGYTGVFLTRLAMRRLNRIVAEEYLKLGGRPYTIEPSSSSILEYGALKNFFLDGVKAALSNGFTPILHGDVVLDLSERRVSILSGDVIASTLAIELKADKLIYVLDVSGIYTKDPKENPDARPLRWLSEESIKKVSIGGAVDATGGLLRKIKEAFKASRGGVKFICFLGWRGDNLFRALRGLRFKGTILGRV